MTSTATEPDAVIGARITAWLRVGGSWTAIAAAHGVTDVDAFKQRYAPSAVSTRPQRAVQPVQLQLFNAA